MSRAAAVATQDNQISSLTALEPLSRLESLNAANNAIRSLAGCQGLALLHQLDVTDNRLGTLESLAPLRATTALHTLYVAGNDFLRAMDAKLHLLHLLPKLTYLDGDTIDAKDKVHAANLHDADAHGLLEIRQR